MEALFELAGWCAAEAIRLLSQNSQLAAPANQPALNPFLVTQVERKRCIVVLEESSPKMFSDVEELFEKLSPSNTDVVLVKDGYVTIDGRKSDALVLEAHRLERPRKSFCMAIVYYPPDAGREFAVEEPKLVSLSEFDVKSIDVDTAFSRGRDEHKEGAAVWRAHKRGTA